MHIGIGKEADVAGSRGAPCARSDLSAAGEKPKGDQQEAADGKAGHQPSDSAAVPHGAAEVAGASLFCPLLRRRTRPALKLGSIAAACEETASKSDDGAREPSPLETTYRLVATLGSGTYSIVHCAERRADGQKVVLKQVRCQRGDEAWQTTKEEHAVLSSISHPAIISAFAWHETARDVWICMEHCNLGSVMEYVTLHGPLDVFRARPLVRQLLDAVNHIHQKRIVHRDVKPENLLLSDGSRHEMALKLADFNSAKRIGDHEGATAMLSDRGTRLYAAPEIRSGIWNERVDVWGCGLSFFFMHVGRLPFVPGPRESQRLLTLGLAPPMDFRPVRGFMGNLVQQCLEPDPRSRPPAMELLAHPAFRRTAPRLSQGLHPCRSCNLDDLLIWADKSPAARRNLATGINTLWRRQSWPPDDRLASESERFMEELLHAVGSDPEATGSSDDSAGRAWTEPPRCCERSFTAPENTDTLSSSACSSKAASPSPSPRRAMEAVAVRRFVRMVTPPGGPMSARTSGGPGLSRAGSMDTA